MENIEKQKIEFENVTLRVPKRIMDYLRAVEKLYKQTAAEYLEYSLVDMVRADIQAMSGSELAGLFDLNPVFKALVNDEVQ